MPDSPPVAKWHARLEWWRRIGLDAVQNPEDDSIKWRMVIFFVLLQVATLVTFIVLCFDVVPGGASTWSNNGIWGGPKPSGICEFENQDKMVHQLSSAISAFGYAFVGIFIGMLTWFDCIIVWDRFRAGWKNIPPRPYCKGPRGEGHIKVTAIAAHKPAESQSGLDLHEQFAFVSVDPDYLSGSVPALLRREPLWGWLLSCSISFLAVASYLDHASNTQLASRLDYTAWFCVGCAFSAYSLARAMADSASPRANVCGLCEPCGVVCRVQCDTRARKRGSKLATYILIGVTVALDILAGFFFNFVNFTVIWTTFAVLAVIVFLSTSLHYFGRKEEVDTWFELGLFAATCFGIGLLFLHYDLIGLCVDPQGYFQAHAIWQSFSAAALAFLYLTFRSDMWMYDLVVAHEDRRHEALDEAYRVPELEFDMEAPGSFSNPRRPSANSQPGRRVEIDDRPNGSTLEASRRRTLERENSAARNMTGAATTRPRTLDRDSSDKRRTSEREGSESGQRRRVDREDSGSSRTSSRRLEALRTQAKNRDSRKTNRTLDSESDMDSSIGAAYWTCPECAYEDNELGFLVCERCQAERPPLSEFVPVSVVQGYM